MFVLQVHVIGRLVPDGLLFRYVSFPAWFFGFSGNSTDPPMTSVAEGSRIPRAPVPRNAPKEKAKPKLSKALRFFSNIPVCISLNSVEAEWLTSTHLKLVKLMSGSARQFTSFEPWMIPSAIVRKAKWPATIWASAGWKSFGWISGT